MAEWIDVNEKLPKEDERVLVYIKPQKGLNEHITVARFVGALFLGGEGYFSFEKATHWQPLPKPPITPKERGGEK